MQVKIKYNSTKVRLGDAWNASEENTVADSKTVLHFNMLEKYK